MNSVPPLGNKATTTYSDKVNSLLFSSNILNKISVKIVSAVRKSSDDSWDRSRDFVQKFREHATVVFFLIFMSDFVI